MANYLQNLLVADNFVLFAYTKGDLRIMLTGFDKESREFGLK